MTTAPSPTPEAPDGSGAGKGARGDAGRPRSIAANSASLAIAQAVVKLLGFAIVFVLTRSVSVEAYGRYAFAFAFAAMLQPLADPGTEFHATRMVSRDASRAGDYLGASIALKLALLPIFAGVTIALAWFTGHRGDTLLLVGLAVAASWLLVLCASYLAVMRGLRRMDYEAWFLIVTRVAALALSLAALALGYGVMAVGAAQVAGTAVGLPLVFAWTSRLGVLPRLRRARSLAREMLVGGLPFAATSVLVMVYFRIDVLMLSAMRGERSVGLYGAGTNVMFGVLIASQVLVMALFPVIARHGSLTDPAARSVCRRALTLSLLVSTPFAVGACLVPGPVLALLYGAPYAEAARAFTFLMLTLPVLFVTNLVGNALGAVGRQRAVMAIAGVNLLLNVGLNLWLIPRLDYAGAALATLVTELCGLALFAFTLRRELGGFVAGRAILGIAAANAAMAAVLLLVRGWPIAAALAAAGVAYVAAAGALRLVRPSDLRSLLPSTRDGAAA